MTRPRILMAVHPSGGQTSKIADTLALAHRFCDATGLAPSLVGLFDGAVTYTRYGWWKRRLVRAVAARGGLDTDVTRDHDFTDWTAVDRFATGVYAVSLGSRPSRTPWST